MDIKTEHIFELRYKAMGEVLDIRGTLADTLLKELNFKHWNISSNRVDIKDDNEKNKDSAFVSHLNCGFISIEPDTKNYFHDNAIRFLRKLLQIEKFRPESYIRLGVRSTFIAKSKLSFEALVNRFEERFISPERKLNQLFNATLVDIGLPINFKSHDGNFNIVIGPMKKEQAKQYFKREQDLPEIGLFFDVDYFQEDLGQKREQELTRLIKIYAEQSWEKFDIVKNLILG